MYETDQDFDPRQIAASKLRQNVKAKILEVALQACKMEGKSSKEDIIDSYLSFCEVVSVSPPAPDNSEDDKALSDWIDARCSMDPQKENHCPAADLYSDFRDWYFAKSGKKPPSATWFGKKMSRQFQRVKKNGVNHYFGICTHFT